MNRIFVENFVNETNNQILRAPDMRTACFGAFAFKISKPSSENLLILKAARRAGFLPVRRKYKAKQIKVVIL